MACILKIPSESGKGIISFTTPEEKEIRKSKRLMHLIKNELKKRFIVCLHYNWHNFDAKPDGLFDVHFAGKEDLTVTNNQNINLFEFDACNFTKKEFNAQGCDKMWDILYVARAVYFKGIEDFLKVIRALYDQEGLKRVLFICPMPPEGDSKKFVLYDLKKLYDRMFTEEEKDYFNLLIIKDRYPFFFDRQTLAHFYRSSRIFVHTAPDERRCRVAAYAWCSGLPVVAMKNVASIIPDDLKSKPAFYEAKDYQSYVPLIKEALEKSKTSSSKAFDEVKYQDYLSEIFMVDKMKKLFAKNFSIDINNSDTWFTENLDIRMGRHHTAGISGPNNLPESLESLVTRLISSSLSLPSHSKDVEKAILLPTKISRLRKITKKVLKK